MTQQDVDRAVAAYRVGQAIGRVLVWLLALLVVVAACVGLGLLVASAAGCAASPRDAAVTAADVTIVTGDALEHELARSYEADQLRCRPLEPDARAECVATVRRRYDPAWDAYDRYLAAWRVVAALDTAADGGLPPEEQIIDAATRLGLAARALSEALRAANSPAPDGGAP